MNIQARIKTERCKHAQNDGTTEYYVLRLEVEGKEYTLRMDQHDYTNDYAMRHDMLSLFSELAHNINRGKL